MNKKEPTKTFKMISNLKNPLVSKIVIKNQPEGLKGLAHHLVLFMVVKMS